MGKVYRSEFLALDASRRARGGVLAALGFGPVERRYQVRAAGPGWRLRDYGGGDRASLLVIGAPIKRPYIWDLAPSVSAIGYCLDRGFGVHLLEWTPPEAGDTPSGLDDYIDAIAQAVDLVNAVGPRPVLLGHSLGGTLAAVCAAVDPAPLAGLVLLGAPVCFGPGAGRFCESVISLAGPAPEETDLVPGSLLGQASAVAAPFDFVWSRLTDAALSLGDPQAFAIHMRVECWALDEVPLPGKLMGQVLVWLYREDRFFRGVLPVKGRTLGPRDLSAPTLAVFNAADHVSPSGSVKAFLGASPARSQVLEYPGEAGVALQHLALLVGPRARASVWPQIVAWADDVSAMAQS